MIEFIVDNHQIIILGCACLLDVILFVVGIFKKNKTAPLDEVLRCIPGFISKIEREYGSGNGAMKKDKVLHLALNLYERLTGVSVSQSSWISEEISSFIEKVLKTPQKKG